MCSRLFLIFLAAAFFPSEGAFAQSNPAKPIMDQVLRAMDNIQTLSGRVKRRERMVDGHYNVGDMRFKMMVKPRKIYVYNYKPSEGAEVLWAEGWNNNKAYVHPNKFPWVNVSLHIHSGNLLDEQHHDLMAVGFVYTRGILGHVMKKYADDFDKYVTYEGTEEWYGKKVHVVRIRYDEYGFEEYTVQKGEDLFDIDLKLHVPAYKLIEINEDVDDFFDVKAGQVIKVPNVYAKDVMLMIDTETYLPVVQMLSDEKGLFEKYEYHDIKVNPRFRTDEFTEDFPEYGY